jgi:hypothetical protein
LSEVKNIDDVLVKAMSDQANGITPAPSPATENVPPPEAESKDDTLSPEMDNQTVIAKEEAQESDVSHRTESAAEKETDNESPIDEYGNPIAAPRTYTDDEVQRMIRDRLSRGRHAEPATPKDAEGFKPDPESNDDWQKQLDDYIDNRLERREKKITEKQWQQQEAQRQAQFEEKFSTGIAKYKDFDQVTRGKPITDAMMLAARELENPAAFIYGAAKLHAQELESIARIPDAYGQAMAVGRLHEKMVKEQRKVTQAAKPLEVPKGDMPNKALNQPSLEDRIAQHAKQKRR